MVLCNLNTVLLSVTTNGDHFRLKVGQRMISAHLFIPPLWPIDFSTMTSAIDSRGKRSGVFRFSFYTIETHRARRQQKGAFGARKRARKNNVFRSRYPRSLNPPISGLQRLNSPVKSAKVYATKNASTCTACSKRTPRIR